MATLVAVGGLACASKNLYAPWDIGARAAWVQEGGGAAAHGGPEPPLALRWQQDVGAAPLGGPLLAGPLLLQLTREPDLLALDLATGTRLGRRGEQDPVCGPPALSGPAGEHVLLSRVGKKPALEAVDRATGDVAWRWPGVVCAGPVVAGDTVFAAGEGGTLAALAAGDGTVLWHIDAGARILAAPTLAGDLLLLGDASGGLSAICADSGRVRWRARVDGAVRTRPAVDPALGLAWVATGTGAVAAVRLADGAVAWTGSVNGLPSDGLARTGQVVAIGSSDRNVYAFDARTGQAAWRYQTGGVVAAAPVATEATVYAASGDGALYAVDAASGNLGWKYQLDGPALTPASLGPGLLAVTTHAGTVYLFAGR